MKLAVAIAQHPDLSRWTVRHMAIMSLLQDGPSYNGALARDLNIGKAVVFRCVTSLQRTGFVKKQRGTGKGSRRPIMVALTATGRELMKDLSEGFAR